MNPTQPDRPLSYELLLDFYEGVVDSKTRADILQRLETDDISKGILEGIEYYFKEKKGSREELEAYLDNLALKLKAKHVRKENVFRMNFAMKLAAGVLIILIPIAFFWLNSGVSPHDLLAEAVQEPYRNPYITVKGENQNDPVKIDFNDSLRIVVGELYDQKAYDKIIPILEIISQNGDIQSRDNLMIGLCSFYKASPDYDKAIESFDLVLESKNRLLVQQTKWYKALAFYKAGNLAAAEKNFSEISNDPNHYNQKKATILLKLFE